MGTFPLPMEGGDPEDRPFERMAALVDMGASHTVPALLLRRPWRAQMADDAVDAVRQTLVAALSHIKVIV